jgi:hypothetical protein
MLNTVYRLNKWLDNSNYTLLIIVGSMLLANIFLFLTTYIVIGILFYIIVSLLSILRLGVHSGKIKFRGDVYDVPVIGEKIKITRGFYWNGAFSKNYPMTDLGSKPSFYVIDKGGEWEIIDIKELDGDWMIYMLNDESTHIHIKYFESRKYWETKSQIRNKTLSKLGI